MVSPQGIRTILWSACGSLQPARNTLGDAGFQYSSSVRKAGFTHWLKGPQVPWMHSIGPQLQQLNSWLYATLYNPLHNWAYDLLRVIQIFSNTFQNLSVLSRAHLRQLTDNFELTTFNRKTCLSARLHFRWDSQF